MLSERHKINRHNAHKLLYAPEEHVQNSLYLGAGRFGDLTLSCVQSANGLLVVLAPGLTHGVTRRAPKASQVRTDEVFFPRTAVYGLGFRRFVESLVE